jgi:diguanylate cyclase (GGDEF)-like protein/PAS domain S-box-containing protein
LRHDTAPPSIVASSRRVAGVGLQSPSETRVFKVKDGLPSDVVYGIAEDADGTLWVATRAGLARIRGDQVSNLAKTANLPRRSPVHLQLDGLGSLWATADDGIYRIALNDLNRAAEHADRTLSPDVFTTRDGLASVEVSWRCSGQAVGGDGRIYYATARGLSFVNPRGILTKRAPPNPEIVKVSAAGSAIAWSNGATISDGRERLDFRYTSPDLDAPDALEFRYRLAGYDPDWVEARSARTAHYTNVPAGKYRFSVAVRRPSGEWSAAGASVQVAVLPRWYETLPARILLGFSGLLAAYGLYRIRVFYLRKNERVLRSKVAERTEELRREVAERKSAEERVQSLVAELDQRVRERTAQLEFANLATRRSEERYALAVQGAQDGLWDWDLMASHFYLSPRWKAMLGYEDHELMSSLATWLSRVHPDDLAGFRHAIEPRPNHPGQIRHEYRMLDRSGAELWMLCRGIMVFDDDGKAVRAAGSQTDITARKLGEAELRRKATHDALTGLPNRLLFGDRLEQALLRARPGDPPQLAVLFLDIDHFKTINDSIGHGAGDQVLAEAAQRIKSSLRETDTAARLGGDEFAVILPELPDAAYATLIADRIQAKLNAPFLLGERQLSVAASIGVRLYSEAARAEDVLRDADTAMYRAKTEGRARTQLFEDGMRHEAVDRLRIEAGLRRALSNDELVLYYQPLVSLESGLAVGVEALVRWQDPERGLLPPSEFIGVAEACGLIGPLSEWVLETAFTQARKWQAQYPSPLRVSVNIPPQLLNDPRLASKIIERLQRLELKPSSVGLEIVETSVLETRPSVLENLEQLRTHGIQLAIDDFGTGYSSFGYLRRLPVGCLKIDRAFTQNLPTNANDATICRTILAMAAELGLSAVAEGVERAEQADFLRASGCAVAQGYYFCRPLPAEDCTRFLDSLEPKARRGQNPDESRSGHIELH